MAQRVARDDRRHIGGQRGRDGHQEGSKVAHDRATDPRERGVQRQPAVEERTFPDDLARLLLAVIPGERKQRDFPGLRWVAVRVGKRKQAAHGMAGQVRRTHPQ